MKYLKIIVLAGLTFMMSCNNANNTADKIGNEITEATNQISVEAKTEWSQTKAKAKVWQSKIDNEIAKLDKKIENSQNEMKEEAREQKAELTAWKEQLQDQVDKLSKDLGEDWNDVVNETKNYFDEIEEELNS